MRSHLWLLPCALAFALSVLLHVVWLRELDHECEVAMRSSPTIITVPVLVTPAKLDPPWCPRGGLHFASRSSVLEVLRGRQKGPGLHDVLFGSRGLRAGDSVRALDGHLVGGYDDLVRLLRARVPTQARLHVEFERYGMICRRTIWLD
jgi:type II secretory pathway component PulC